MAYVVTIASVATVGFAAQTPWPILLAALLALPASVVAVPYYYLVSGVLALVPGASPSSSSGSGTSTAGGVTSVTTGMPADWFTVTTHVLGILALTAAALVNVLLLRALAMRRRDRRGASEPSPSSGPVTH